MLQQTRVEAVVPYFEKFLDAFPNVFALAAAEEEQVLQHWAGLGYYRRARFLHGAARMVVEEWGGVFPETAEELRAMPGVGAYTSAAIASLAFGEKAPVVDGNVKRVIARWSGLELAADASALEKEARRTVGAWMAELPAETPQAPGELNEALMELGAVVCRPKVAECAACPIAEDCEAKARGLVDALPLPKKAKKWVDLEMVFLVLRVGVRVGLEKRSGGWSPGLYEPPSAPCQPFSTATEIAVAHEAAALELATTMDLQVGVYRGMIRHTITHHRIRAHVYSAQSDCGPPALVLADPEAVPLTGLARKVLDRSSQA